jgi:hypothetical protein
MHRYLKAALLGAALLAAAPSLAGPYASTVVASGLNNPRGLTFGSDGALYIAESGMFTPGGPTTVVRGQTATFGDWVDHSGAGRVAAAHRHRPSLARHTGAERCLRAQ